MKEFLKRLFSKPAEPTVEKVQKAKKLKIEPLEGRITPKTVGWGCYPNL